MQRGNKRAGAIAEKLTLRHGEQLAERVRHGVRRRRIARRGRRRRRAVARRRRRWRRRGRRRRVRLARRWRRRWRRRRRRQGMCAEPAPAAAAARGADAAAPLHGEARGRVHFFCFFSSLVSPCVRARCSIASMCACATARAGAARHGRESIECTGWSESLCHTRRSTLGIPSSQLRRLWAGLADARARSAQVEDQSFPWHPAPRTALVHPHHTC